MARTGPPSARGLRLGIDLGGTKIEAALLDAGGAVRFRRRAATPSGDYGATLRAIAALVAAADAEAGTACPVGVGIPGSLSPRDGLVRNANSVWLNGKPLQDDLEAALRRPVRLANDANCFALSEAVDGAGAGARVVFGVILGTGVGGGIAIDRTVLPGATGIAGEWGHTPLPPGDGHGDETGDGDGLPDRRCWCGRTGCVETYLSGPGLALDAGLPGTAAEELPARAAAGDAAARAALDRHAARLARALAVVANILDPDVVILGGGLSNLPGLADTVAARWRPHIFSDMVTTPILTARHGDSSGVRGAAWLWPAEDGDGDG